MIITYVYSNRLEDQIRVQLRCRNFADAINRTGSHHANLLDINSFIQNTQTAQKMCAESDILVIYRYIYGPILTTIQYWKARKKKVIVDFDQAIDHLTPGMPGYYFWLKGTPLPACTSENKHPENPIVPIPLEQFKWGLGIVDAATTASARLANDWSQFTCVYEIPDYLNTFQYPVLEQPHKDEIWIGLGHNTQYTSFKNSGLSVAMEYICQQYPQVKLVLFDQGDFPDRQLKIDPAQVVVYSPPIFDEWVNVLLKLDIGLAPIYGDYDLRSGPVKLLEFMIAKIPWIATEHPTFRNMAQYGYWVQNSPDAWENAILNVVTQLAVYQKRADGESFSFALGQDVSENIEKVLRIYSVIINKAPGQRI